MKNEITTWRQGAFIDQHKYVRMSEEWKEDRRHDEALLVRPAPMQNAICKTNNSEDAEWIANRLNLAANLERMLKDHAEGKPIGDSLREFHENLKL